MNTLQKALQEYLAMRRALGFQLLDAGPALSDFVSFLKRRRTCHITIRLALEWAQKPGAQPARWAHRLGFVRGFARYRSATDPRTEIPPWRLLPFRSKRARPYLYTDDEVRTLLKASLRLSPNNPLRKWTCLLYTSEGTWRSNLVALCLRLSANRSFRTAWRNSRRASSCW